MFELDVPRARLVAQRLLAAYETTGIFGNQAMPEDVEPAGVATGSEEHLRFITLTVAIDYMRNADQLWNAARQTFADPQTHYLFDPTAVAQTGLPKIVEDMRLYRLSKKIDKDAEIWRQVSLTLAQHFGGRVDALITQANYDALTLLDTIRSRRFASGFPYLKGPKVAPLWIRMLHDNCGVALRRIEEVPLPVDIHTAQATLQTGCVRRVEGRGTMKELREAVQQVWRGALTTADSGTYPLRMDEPLWMLSRQGCRVTRTWPCEFLAECPVGLQCQAKQLWLAAATGGPIQDETEWTITPRAPEAS